MKKYLPKIKNYLSGFTLVELLVVVAIIAILAVIGITIFTGVQKNARDARRRADIDAIASAMEANYTNGAYAPLAAGQFSAGAIPLDPTNTNVTPDGTCAGVCEYCVRQGAAVQTGAACTIATAPAAAGLPAGTSTNPYWVVCANLEGGTPTFYCRGNAQ